MVAVQGTPTLSGCMCGHYGHVACPYHRAVCYWVFVQPLPSHVVPKASTLPNTMPLSGLIWSKGRNVIHGADGTLLCPGFYP